MNAFEAELEKKYVKAVRLKTVKELEKEYSKELINIYKQKEKENEREEEFRSVVFYFLN
jgi:hypothetical protein